MIKVDFDFRLYKYIISFGILFLFCGLLLTLFTWSKAFAIPYYLGIANDQFTIENDEYMNSLKKWENWANLPANRFQLLDNAGGNAILAALNNLNTFITADDIVLFSYSGHTEQLPAGDANGDENAGTALTSPDEYLGLETEARANWITDDQIANALGTLPASTTLVMFMNTCFGGGYIGGTSDPSSLTNVAIVGSVPETQLCPAGDAVEAALQAGALTWAADMNNDNKVFASEWFNYMNGVPAAAAQNPLTFNNLAGIADRPILVNPIPEPSTLLLFVVGILGLIGSRRACSQAAYSNSLAE